MKGNEIMDYSVKYIGSHKIQAIKTVREIFGLGLKEAKDIVEGDPARVTTLQKFAILGVYLADAYDNGREVWPSDWTFVGIPPADKYENLTENQPMDRG